MESVGTNPPKGGAGQDTLDGGQSNDNLDGGADDDTFNITSAEDGIGDIVDGSTEGTDFDTLDLTGSVQGNGSLSVTFTNPDSNGNGFDGFVTYFDEDGNETGKLEFTEIENVVPCFTPGTMIATPRGEVPIETMEVGDKVITRDNGIQTIQWIGRREMKRRDFDVVPYLLPIRISQGALGETIVQVTRTREGALHGGDLAPLLDQIQFGNYHAVVIGNDDYSGDIPELETAVKDAKVLAQLLETDYDFDVDLLLNADRQDILQAVEE